MNSYDVFLADDRIIPLLPKLLGKKWIEEKKRQPTPVRLTRDDLAAELKTALGSTNLLLNRGTCMTIKVGTHDVHDSSQLIDNILAVVPYLAVRLPKGGWENVQALHIKSSTSLSLPIWSCDLSTERFDQTKPDPATQLSVLPSNLADDDENDDDGDEEADVEEIDESELKAIKKDAAKEGGGAAAGAKRKRGSATTGGKLESNKEQSPAKKVKGEAKPESTPRGGDKVKKRRSSAGKSKA